jgi:hypothetical protein
VSNRYNYKTFAKYWLYRSFAANQSPKKIFDQEIAASLKIEGKYKEWLDHYSNIEREHLGRVSK